jgi:hypothetical protein
MIKALLDTNLYVGWFNTGLYEAVMVGPGSSDTSARSYRWSSEPAP